MTTPDKEAIWWAMMPSACCRCLRIGSLGKIVHSRFGSFCILPHTLWTLAASTSTTEHQESFIIDQTLNLEKAMAPHSSTLAWEIPWTEEPGRLQSMRSLRVGHDWATSLSIFTFHALEKEMATHSSVLAWRIPGTGEPGGLPSMGSHRVGHNWHDLAAADTESALLVNLLALLLWRGLKLWNQADEHWNSCRWGKVPKIWTLQLLFCEMEVIRCI